MYHPPPKRKQLIQRIVVYGAMTIAVVSLVIILVLVMLGYRFDGTDGKQEQGGLMQFSSRPTGAAVTVDGITLGGRTPTKTTADSGNHFVTMNHDGYRQWQKAVTLMPGSILWLDYTRFIPNDLTPVQAATFEGAGTSAASPDGRWMAVVEKPTQPTIKLADLSNDEVRLSDLVLPKSSYTEGSGHSFVIHKWDPDSRYILLKHGFDRTKSEWLVVDSRDARQTKNITTQLGIAASQVKFTPDGGSNVYAVVEGALRRIDTAAATMSGPLVRDVAEFSFYDQSTIVYVTKRSEETLSRDIGFYRTGDERPTVIRAYKDNGKKPLHIAADEYFSDTYLAVSYGTRVDVYINELRELPQTNSQHRLASFDMGSSVRYLSMKTNGRFVIAQDETSYTVYDIELKKTTTTVIKNKKTSLNRQLEWLDRYIVWNDQGGTLRFYEFDGANQNDIMPVTPGYAVTLSPNGRYVYGLLKKTDDTYALQRVRLILP